MLPLPAIEPQQPTPAVVRSLLAWAKTLGGSVEEPYSVQRAYGGTVYARPGELIDATLDSALSVVLPPARSCSGKRILVGLRSLGSYLASPQPGEHINGRQYPGGMSSSAQVALFVSDGLGWWSSMTGSARWDDLAPARSSVASGVSSMTTQVMRDTPMQYDHFRHDQDDELYFQYQMSHRWVVGSPVNPHLHVIPCASGSGVAHFTGQYAWTQIGSGQAIPANAGWTSFSAQLSIAVSDQYNELPISLAGRITPPSWADASAHLHIVVRRSGTGPFDTYTTANPVGTGAANLALVSADCHALNYPEGTIIEFPGGSP